MDNADLLRRFLSPLTEVGVPQRHLDAAIAFREANLADLEARAHLRLAKLLRRRGERAAADEALAAALRAQPRDLACQLEHADILAADSDFPGAESVYRHILEQDRDHALAHRGLGYVMLRTERYADSESHLRRAVRLRSRDAEAHVYLGAARTRQGRLAEARDDFRRALELMPEHAQAADYLATVEQALAQR